MVSGQLFPNGWYGSEVCRQIWYKPSCGVDVRIRIELDDLRNSQINNQRIQLHFPPALHLPPLQLNNIDAVKVQAST